MKTFNENKNFLAEPTVNGQGKLYDTPNLTGSSVLSAFRKGYLDRPTIESSVSQSVRQVSHSLTAAATAVGGEDEG
jgi:hypothetical protein